MSVDRESRIRACLVEAFDPVELLLKDQSHMHAGHVGAQDGKGHFDVTIVADRFATASRIQRHRMVYDALGDLLQTDIHALRIKALSPAER